MFPRRTKDLLHLNAGSEEKHKTSIKQADYRQPQKQDDNEYDKENKVGSDGTRGNISGTFSKLRMYPKRSSELPAFESDSDDDDNNLNCAILNDSFIMSPVKGEQNYSDSLSSNAVMKIPSNKIKNDDKNMSLVKRFNDMVLSVDNNTATTTGADNIPKESSKSNESFDVARKLVNDNHRTEEVKSITSSIVSQNNTKENINATPLLRFNSEPTPQQKILPQKEEQTPFKSASNGATGSESLFVTPQVRVRSFSVQRRPQNDLCSTQEQSQKTRSDIDNEFRSQKVLFQTPMAMARACLPNESITLSLCDSINEQVIPQTKEKSPEIVNDNVFDGKSKKSLVEAFNELQNVSANQPKIPSAVKSSAAALPTSLPSSSSSSNLATKETTSTTDNKETILEINSAKYAIIKKLGTGGSSSVYLAQRKDNEKEYALKIVDLHGDAAVVEGYLNETKLLAKLQGNACVVSLYEYELLQKESKLYMVMEKGDYDLNKILQNYKTSLPLYVLMNYWYQMLQAVNYIHQNGVIHSDLKPANFLMVNGRLKLIDFGIASNIAIDSTSIIKFSQAGTFNYISPEALTDTSTGSSPIRNQPKIKISTKSDVWSLGCILYLLLYKRTPFSHILNICAKISAISSPSHPIDYPAIPFYYPSMLVHMAKKCLQHDPKQRPSCAELLQYPFNMVIPIQNLTVPQK